MSAGGAISDNNSIQFTSTLHTVRHSFNTFIHSGKSHWIQFEWLCVYFPLRSTKRFSIIFFLYSFSLLFSSFWSWQINRCSRNVWVTLCRVNFICRKREGKGGGNYNSPISNIQEGRGRPREDLGLREEITTSAISTILIEWNLIPSISTQRLESSFLPSI